MNSLYLARKCTTNLQTISYGKCYYKGARIFQKIVKKWDVLL